MNELMQTRPPAVEAAPDASGPREVLLEHVRQVGSAPTALPPCVCVVVHDVADATQSACERLIAAIEAVGPVPLTLLAVPRYHGTPASPGLGRWLDERYRGHGDEIALHGWTHRDDGAAGGLVDRLRRTRYTRGEGEFWSLDADEAASRLAAGIRWFEAHGWPLHGFVAPAWLLGTGGWQALRETPFSYTSTLRHIHLLGSAGAAPRLTSQSIVYSTSSAWRRQSSRLWAASVEAAQRRNPVLRLELHPADADSAGIRRSWQGALERALCRREALTVATLATRWRRASAAAEAGAVKVPSLRAG